VKLMAIVKALSIIPKGDELKITSDSMYAIQGICEGNTTTMPLFNNKDTLDK